MKNDSISRPVRLRAGIAILAVCLLPNLCLAWGGNGHQLTAMIAEHQLTPAAKALVKDLLGTQKMTDSAVANWADTIRSSRPETAGWHYVNIPTTVSTFNRTRDGNNGANIVDALAAQQRILVDKTQTRTKRIEALKWVIHLCGDIEQPLHCAERNGDKGGNTRYVYYPNATSTIALHAVWDTSLIREVVANRTLTNTAYALAVAITSAQRTTWAKGSSEAWANETHLVANNVAYNGVPATGAAPRLTTAYVQKGTTTCNEQLKRGGVRLATIINNAAK